MATFKRKPDRKKKKTPRPPAESLPDDELTRDTFPIVGVGASAGGLEAFTQLLEALPTDTGMGFVLVQHLDPDHESQLTQILARSTSLPVGEITNEESVQPNRVYVIPRDTNLTLVGGVLKVQPRERTRAPHRPIDSFFESLAQDRRERAVGVVLSGTASDGTLGLEAIKAEGGITFAQDDSAKHDSMPHSAVAAGCVDLVLSPAEIARELARIAKHPYVGGQALLPRAAGDSAPEDDRASATAHEDDQTPLPSGGKGTPRTGGKQAQAEADRREREDVSGDLRTGERDYAGYKKILLLLRSHSGVDFSLYKSTTIRRRINRRLVLNKQDTLEAYADMLRGNAKELDALYSDVLISVTSFFRNPETFDALQQNVLPQLLKQRGDDPLRCWVLGCSTGQEAYSIAMAFTEAADKASRARRLQIFATDLNDALLDKARHGLYAKSLVEDITPQRLRRFFVEEEGGYRVAKTLREMVVFARQNVIADPPFSRMDLISCRNLLIYLEPGLQKKAIPTFHYALKPGGFLLLGASESVGGFTDLFEPVDKKHKIYAKKLGHIPTLALPLKKERGAESTGTRPSLPVQKVDDSAEGFHGELNAQREADRITVNQFAPPAVLVNSELQVLQFRGPTGAFLQPPVGKASFDLLKMAREGLMLPLRSVLNEARKENKVARKNNVRVKRNGRVRTVNLEVIPLRNLRERCFLILFEEADKADGARGTRREPKRVRKGRSPGREEPGRVAELEAELSELREYLQSMQEQHEAANEEVQSANEEVQSANEELQSINEELETSKEELESANEELTTVNEEMSNRNVELNRLNNDLVNLQASTKLSVVLFGRDLTIRRFSPPAEKQFDLLVTDVGRPIGHLRHGLVEMRPAIPRNATRQPRASASKESPIDLERIITDVITEVREQEREVVDRAGCWRSLRVRPYMTHDNKVDGAVLVLMDIDSLKRSELAIAASRDYAENIVETVREPLLVLDTELLVESANRSFYRTFRVTPAESIGRPIFDLGNRQWDIPRLRELLAEIGAQSTSIEDFEVEYDSASLGRRTMLFSARRMQDPQGTGQRILVSIEDITDRKRAEVATGRLAAIVASSDDAIVSLSLDGVITSWNRGAERLYGYGAVEAVGQNITLIIPADRRSEEDEVLTRLRRGERVEHFDTERQAKDGRRITVSLTASPIKDAEGKVSGLSKISRDVTEQRRVEGMVRESEERFRTLVEQVRDYAIFRTDAQGRATTWNEGVKRVLGFDEADFVGTDITGTIFTPEDIQGGVPQRELAEAAEKGTASNDRWMRRKNGERFAAAGVTTSLKNERGELLGFTKVMRDQTAKVQAEAAQRQLEKELRRYSTELSEGAGRKNEFLAMLGHELRNPLSVLSHALDLLERLPDENSRRQELRAMMARQTKRIGVLLDQLLDIARVTSGKVELAKDRIDLANVVRAAAESVIPLVESQKHRLNVTIPVERTAFVMGDVVRLTQVVENLLTNAAKYTNEGGQIDLSLELVSEEKVRIAVRDNGIGMSAEFLPHIFEVFTQAPRTLERAKGGLGLGLPLAQRLIEMHGGEISVSSPGLGLGSEFVVTLPRAIERRSKDREHARVEPGRVRPRRILIVDDEEDAREAFAALLEQEGHEVLAVEDGPAALQAVRTFGPEVVLLDLGLPEMDGYEVARKLRAEHGDKKILLIAVTGYQNDVARLKEAGVDHHLVKPPDLQKLSALLTASDGGERVTRS